MAGRGAIPGGRSGGFNFDGGFSTPQTFGGGGGGGGGFMSSLANFLSGNDGSNALDLLNTGLNFSFGSDAIGIEEDKLNILQSQNQNAVNAQNFSLANMLSLQRQTTIEGTPEHAAVLAAQENGTFQASA